MITAFIRRAAALFALLGVLCVSQGALAYPGAGGVHGGAHFGGYGHVGSWHGGGWRGGGWRGGGWYGGGWRGGYYGWGFFGAGLWLTTLPWYYSTYWWGGVPYYYADNAYYVWNGASGRYESVRPPAGIEKAPAAQTSTELFMYPKSGQSAEQQARDRYECHRWAADQTGFDPTHSNGGVSADSSAAKRADYLRAQGACLEGRNYSVR
jgi:hypothetical protein